MAGFSLLRAPTEVGAVRLKIAKKNLFYQLIGVFAMKLKNIFVSVAAASAAILAPAVVLAAEGSAAAIDFSGVTAGFSVVEVVSAVMSIAAGLMTLYLAIKGVQTIMNLVRGR
ncbi:hypothetical protein [Pectobacterium quasiaquaticum]|uniref:hypothetical protein n=1 Tax=Pectobacterium quasiaquaticum TaxID=2774015 RepID=UPI001CF7EC32|nr:hypothetical protein [Pectobacterium quasiaquaticum]